MKIGIFGGSFNPPHNMHTKIALNLIQRSLVDMVVFVPTGDRYTKTDLINAKDRFNMLEIICKKNPRLHVSDYEIKNTQVFAYQTLDYYREKYKTNELFFILGADNLAELDTWQRYKYLLENYHFLVIKREGEDVDELLKKYDYNENIVVTDVEMDSISSTKIRKMLKAHDDNVRKYIDEEVYDYIKKNRLY